MNAIRKLVDVENNLLKLKLPLSFKAKKVEVIVFPYVPKENLSYDFSDVAGKLTWTGSPIKEQRRLRNEWG